MIRDLLHTGPIYDGLKRGHAGAVPGWNDHSKMFAKLIKPTDRTILEIGAWLGRSTIMLAEVAPWAEVVTCDTWTGALEMWTRLDDPTRYGALKMRHGFPTIYHDFRQNIFNHRKENQVTPFPVPSATALRWFKHKGIRPDFVFIDASHEYRDVYADIQGALYLHPRIICGDDYQPGWPGVVRAVTELVPDVIHNTDSFWYKIYE